MHQDELGKSFNSMCQFHQKKFQKKIRAPFTHISTMARTKRLGVGAKISCLSKLLHPSALIRQKYVNPERGHRLENLIVVRLEQKLISRKQQLAVVMTHHGFPDVELHAVKRYCKVTQEGREDLFFDAPVPPQGQDETPLNRQEEISPDVSRMMQANMTRISDEDIAMARNLVETDDDNEPAPENLTRVWSKVSQSFNRRESMLHL